ncbi:hypothetical protein AB205_0059960 [Aquarana catesbeiana]|uniref:Uncharacterized protein n=1 Tax=Aquarana catesbeiana TaxID=8400 RepID=A0A2G9PU70_AQUCT|nr:hypothetical protein AB205_0059960 [Aquarana catesbeiana]
MPCTHSRIFRRKMCDRTLLSEIPTVCRLHHTFSIGKSDTQSLRAGYKIFRQQNPLSEIPIVVYTNPTHKVPRMLRINKEMKAIGYCPVYSPDVRVLRHRVQNDQIFRQLCVTVCMQDKFEPTSVGKNPRILLSECPINVRPCVRGISVGEGICWSSSVYGQLYK